jgi:predicted dehydrogenase
LTSTLPIRVALVGFGRAGRALHTPLVQSTAGFELSVVVSSRPDDVRAHVPAATVVPSAAAAFAMPDVDLVVVAAPSDTHTALALRAIEAGKHVVIDKPFALSVAAARELAEFASQRGVIAAAFQNRRWDGDFLQLREVVAGGALGGVTHFESHIDRYRPDVADRWRERPGRGSGVWVDLGPHLIDQALQLFGLPDRVFGFLASHRRAARTDDYAHVVLEYPRLAAVLHASMLAAGDGPRFVVHGDRGSWIKHGVDPQEFELAKGMGLDVGSPLPESAVTVDGATGARTATPVPRGHYARFYELLRDAIRGRRPNPVPPADAVAVTAVLDAAARSSAERRALTLQLSDAERRAFDDSV